MKKMVVAVYGGGLQGEKTSKFFFVPNELKSDKKQHVFFVFYIIGGCKNKTKQKGYFITQSKGCLKTPFKDKLITSLRVVFFETPGLLTQGNYI